MGTKIQINSLEALERLIGNDTELEMELRSTIVQEFSKKFLKSVANEILDRERGNFEREIKDYSREVLGSYVRDPQCSWKQKYVLAGDLQLEIQTMARNSFAAFANEKIQELIVQETDKAYQKIIDAIDDRLDTKINAFIETRLNDMFNEELEKVKELINTP